ncbi:hypothetical protein ALQ55_102441 [Pseudomonas savastanoi pv. savastanoi]|nr:hypothetical protein ALQ55_102441 [Pseudomonas savastanoi pv. savastanoi]
MTFDQSNFKSLIRPVIDFPKPGVVFRDITPLFQSPKATRQVIDSFVQRYNRSRFQPYRRHGRAWFSDWFGGGVSTEQAAGAVSQTRQITCRRTLRGLSNRIRRSVSGSACRQSVRR